MASDQPDLSIVIVSYNTRALLKACLSSVQCARSAFVSPNPKPESRSPTTEIIVVDNGSTDGSRDMVRREFPSVHLIESDNVGFAAGSNKGIGIARGRHVLLLNPDTEVLDDALGALVRFMDAHPQAGAAGGHLLNADGSFQHSAFRFPSLAMTFIDFFPLNHRVLNSRCNGRYPQRLYKNGSFEIDHPLGACLIVRREVIEQVGVFDEGFFMYCEEIDWCLRIKRAGWQIWHVADARVIHHGAQSTGQFRQRMLVELFRSRARLFRKHYSPLFCWANRQIVRLGLTREMARAWWARRRGHIEPDEYDKRMEAYRVASGLS
jgi:hypothetical protein